MAFPSGRRLFWVALFSNLLVVGSLGLAAWPLATTNAAREAWDTVPASAREAAPVLDRAVDRTLDRLVEGAVGNDPRLLLQVPLQLASDTPVNRWNGSRAAQVRWDTYGSDALAYLVKVSRSSPATNLVGLADDEVRGASANVTLLEGVGYVHVQATYRGRAGPVATLGPFLIDSSPPPAPQLPSSLTSSKYQFVIEWDEVADASGVPTYVVERRANGDAWTPHRTLDEPTFTERNAVNGVYRYRVAAVNGAGLRSVPSDPVEVTVDAASNLAKPAPGVFDRGVRATYDSLLYVWDISDPDAYDSLGEARAALGETRYRDYTGPGWGVETDNATLRALVQARVGGETNTLRIATSLFAWLFDATDYDFDKLNSADGGSFQRAGETLDRGLGICGDLTSLYVTALRIAGVPARPVHGYLLNQQPDGPTRSIGGFHMWAEVYVGGPDPVGGGWIPVDVSGVTGSYEPEKLDIYFGLYNPDYLQLGVQDDLGPLTVEEDDHWETKLRARWNVWATLNWAYAQKRSDARPAPTVGFDAGEQVSELEAEHARLWISRDHRRVVTSGESSPGPGFDRYFPMKVRSVRTLDYGANLTYADDRLTELNLYVKFPDHVAPSQSAIFTPYRRTASGLTVEQEPAAGSLFEEYGDGFFHWRICVDGSRCP